jgi:antitoxin ChpS
MRSTTLRQSGGSIIVSLPKAFVDQLGLAPNAAVDISLEGDTIVLARQKRNRVGLKARLAMCDFTQPATAEDEAWSNLPSVGGEIVDEQG